MSKRAKAKKLSKEHLKCNKPRKTPSHKTKSHVVKACEDGKEKIVAVSFIILFGSTYGVGTIILGRNKHTDAE